MGDFESLKRDEPGDYTARPAQERIRTCVFSPTHARRINSSSADCNFRNGENPRSGTFVLNYRGRVERFPAKVGREWWSGCCWCSWRPGEEAARPSCRHQRLQLPLLSWAEDNGVWEAGNAVLVANNCPTWRTGHLGVCKRDRNVILGDGELAETTRGALYVLTRGKIKFPLFRVVRGARRLPTGHTIVFVSQGTRPHVTSKNIK